MAESYVIEGTVTEIETTENQTKVRIRLCGLEGYLIKQGEKRFNVILCDSLRSGYTIVTFDETEKFEVSSLMINSSYIGHHVKLTIAKIVDDSGQNIDSADKLKVTAITLIHR